MMLSTTKKKNHSETWDSHAQEKSKLAATKKKNHSETWDSHAQEKSKLAATKKKNHSETWDSHAQEKSKLAATKKKNHSETWDSHAQEKSKLAAPKKKIHIETWGCQMNVADSERILQLMTAANYARASSEHDAQLIVLNTCHIREKARHKVISRLGRLRKLKQMRRDLKIAVVGCVAQAEGKRLRREVPAIDYVLGPAQIEQLPRLVKEQAQGSALGFAAHQVAADTAAGPTLTGRFEVSRFLNIMQGCNNYCTFCVVPFTRGPERSQPRERIIAQAQQLVQRGVKEITLLGQNVNSYGRDLYASDNPFVDLLRDVCALEGLQRVRFTTSNPHDFTPALSALFGQQAKLGRYAHLPVQSGSDRILRLMKRKVDVARIRTIVAGLRAQAEDFALSTDVIVGFPGETDADFEQTLALIAAMRCSFIFSFKYSPRRNTPARRLRDQIPEAVKKQRLARLQQVQQKITAALHRAEIGQLRQVLVHYRSRKEPHVYYGRTVHFRPVRIVAARDIVGQVREVRITAANATSLCATLR